MVNALAGAWLNGPFNSNSERKAKAGWLKATKTRRKPKLPPGLWIRALSKLSIEKNVYTETGHSFFSLSSLSVCDTRSTPDLSTVFVIGRVLGAFLGWPRRQTCCCCCGSLPASAKAPTILVCCLPRGGSRRRVAGR